jgi:hypothetical protein
LDCAPNRNISSVNQNIIGFKRRQISGLFTFVTLHTLENIFFPYRRFEIFFWGVTYDMGAGIYILYILPGLKSIRQQWYIYISAVIRVNIITIGWVFFFFKWQLNIKIRKKDQIFLYTFIVVCWRFF